MKSKLIFCLAFLLVCSLNLFGQHKALSFQEAEKIGIPMWHLDSLYKSAVHTDVKLAVFKTEEGQAKLIKAYTQLLQDLGRFLKDNNFKWEGPTKGFNRIYLNANGKIDYFLYNFSKDQLSSTKEKEFYRLLNLFVKDYQFALTAQENFAQCSPVTYLDI